MAKRFSFWLIPPLLIWAGISSYQFKTPDPVCLYTGDFKHLFSKIVKNAQHSIELITYGLSDEDLLALLDQKREHGLKVLALCDARSSPKRDGVTRIKKSGLHHAKITIIDEHLTYLGSANLTTTSLELHHNCVLGINSCEVAQFFQDMLTNEKTGKFTWQNLDLYMLPEKSALTALLQLIDQAKKTIHVAMFTFSHPALIEALERATMRGVQVKLFLDRHTRQPKTTIPICHTRGPGLLHNKLALIDDEHLVIGSANWTKAAFTKNYEVLAFVRNLSPKELKTCKKHFKSLY